MRALNGLFFKKHLDSDEHIQRVVHTIWLLGALKLFWPTVLIAVPWLLYSATLQRAWLTIAVFITCIGAIWWLRRFFDYYLDAWIITDHGIIDVAWFGWFHRQSTRILNSDLQGVSYEVKGIVPTLLRFGNISVEKISTGQSVTLEYVARPKRIELLILRSMEAYVHKKNLKDSSQVRDLLSTMVAEQMQMEEVRGRASS